MDIIFFGIFFSFSGLDDEDLVELELPSPPHVFLFTLPRHPVDVFLFPFNFVLHSKSFAQTLVAGILSPPTEDEIERAIRSAIRKAHTLGLTGIHDAGVPEKHLRIMADLVARKEFDFRLYAMLENTDEETMEKHCPADVSPHRLPSSLGKIFLESPFRFPEARSKGYRKGNPIPISWTDIQE